MARRQDDIVLVRRKVRIGDLLLENNVISKEQLGHALEEHYR